MQCGMEHWPPIHSWGAPPLDAPLGVMKSPPNYMVHISTLSNLSQRLVKLHRTIHRGVIKWTLDCTDPNSGVITWQKLGLGLIEWYVEESQRSIKSKNSWSLHRIMQWPPPNWYQSFGAYFMHILSLDLIQLNFFCDPWFKTYPIDPLCLWFDETVTLRQILSTWTHLP